MAFSAQAVAQANRSKAISAAMSAGNLVLSLFGDKIKTAVSEPIKAAIEVNKAKNALRQAVREGRQMTPFNASNFKL